MTCTNKVKLDDLPEEVLNHICTFCDWRTLAALQCTSHTLWRVAGDAEARAMARVGISAAVARRDVDAMHVYVKHAVEGSERTAVKCVLRFLARADLTALLERQLLCFLHSNDLVAAQLILEVPDAVVLGGNPDSVWLEWCVSVAVWSMGTTSTAMREWVARLALPLRRQDAVFCDHLFFNWPGCYSRMRRLLDLPTADGTPLLEFLLARRDTCFTTSIVNSAEFHHFLDR